VDAPDRKKRSIDTQIDDNLRKIFEEDVEQDLPDRLQRLLEELDGATSDADDEDPGDDTESGGGGPGGALSGGASSGGGGDIGQSTARRVARAPGGFAWAAEAPPRVAQAGPG
jgi:hypothetical protein